MNIKIEIKGIKELVSRFKDAPAVLDKEMTRAFDQSLMLIERNVKMRTPVDKGILRASIGGVGGWKWVTERVASIGTNIKYAYWVEVRQAFHKVGEVGYFSKGVEASMEGVHNFFKLAFDKVAQKLTGK